MSTPLPVIAQVFRCALRWRDSASQQTAVNVIHVITDSAGKSPLEVFTCLDAHVTANMWAGVAAGVSVDQVDIIPLNGTSPTSSFTTGHPAKWSGVNGTEAVTSTACLVKLKTLVRGRANRGRLFLPFLAEGAQVRGFMESATRTTMQNAWDAFLPAIDTDGTTPMNMVVASYDRIHGGAGAHATAVDSALVEFPLGTQRRRQQRNR